VADREIECCRLAFAVRRLLEHKHGMARRFDGTAPALHRADCPIAAVVQHDHDLQAPCRTVERCAGGAHEIGYYKLFVPHCYEQAQ
jgi:hypothetical protein